ncbi:MAG: DUF2442 domain-containing protein [Chloroflexi bacterium]|nr:DUF2442 domain-containing protein [Chloroflexota bacterium]
MDSRWRDWPRARAVHVDSDAVHVHLVDGRQLTVPIEWFGFLAAGTEEQRRDFRIQGDGDGIWWDTLDEGVSVPGLLGLGEMPPPDPSARSYAVDYVPQDGGWTASVRGTWLTSSGSTLAAAKRAVRSNLRRYLGVHSLGSAGIEVVDDIQRGAPVEVG